jgi:hypothetical protein
MEHKVTWRDDPKLVTGDDLRRAAAWMAHWCNADLPGINAVLEETGERTTFFLMALALLWGHANPELVHPSSAALWQDAAAIMATGMRDGDDGGV